MTDFTTSVIWLKRGLIHGVPEKVALSREEIQEIIKEASDAEDSDSASDKNNDDPYDFAHYDDKDDDSRFNIESIAMYTSRDDDPYINIPGMDDEDSDDEDDVIKETDNLIITGNGSRGPDEPGVLDVFVYNVDDGDKYPHHDINLESCPLSIEIILPTSEENSVYVAAGLFNSTIEIHDLHIMNTVASVGTLGSKKNKNTDDSTQHSAPVLSLAWNSSFNHILASGSDDKSVLLWDLEALSVSQAYKGFNDSVECLKWSPVSSETLLVCSSSKSVRMVDGRTNEVSNSWNANGKVVIADWVGESNQFVVGTSKGSVCQFDMRSSKSILDFQAHGTDICGLSVVPKYQGMLAAADSEGNFSVWVTNPSPRRVYLDENQVETLSAFALNPDFPNIGCMVGAKKKGKFFKEFNLEKYYPLAKADKVS